MTRIRFIEMLPGETTDQALERVNSVGGETVDIALSPDIHDLWEQCKAIHKKFYPPKAVEVVPLAVQIIAAAPLTPSQTRHLADLKAAQATPPVAPTAAPEETKHLCRTCGKEIAPTGKRGRPAVICAECKK